jgi:hypothetical protein
MVQSLDAGADLAREPAWHGCWHDARLESHGLDGGGGTCGLWRASSSCRMGGWPLTIQRALVVSEVAVADVVGVREREPHCAQAARLVACADLLRP